MPLHIYFVDVGQGDATFCKYEAPDGTVQYILVDGGSAESASRLIEYLRSQGADRFHLVVATHPDVEHIGGLLQVLAEFPVARFWGPDPGPLESLVPRIQQLGAQLGESGDAVDACSHLAAGLDTYTRLHALALEGGALIEYPATAHDASYLFPGLELRVVGPDPQFQDALTRAPGDGPALERLKELGSALNNASYVLRIGLDGQHALLTGDLELDGWDLLMSQWGAGLRARIFKVSEHGSNRGTDIGVLGTVHPRQAVISVGPNEQGCPAPVVLALLTPPIQLYRTDQQGDVRITLQEAESPPLDIPPRVTWWGTLLERLAHGRS